MSLRFVIAGADVICPSDMSDNRIFAIKQHLYATIPNKKIPVLSYSTKFQSKFYGPFRQAADSAPEFGDRSQYQLPPAGRGLAIRSSLRDIEEGADFIMVKPGMPYLDIIRDLKNETNVPIAVYQVSGEFAMLYHGANNGAFELRDAVMESMTSFFRAGCSIIITYFTPQLLEWIA